MSKGSGNDAAEKFLRDFLEQLKKSDDTNREIVQANRELVQSTQGLLAMQQSVFAQNNQIIRALSTLSAQVTHMNGQINDLTERMDYLYSQMGNLGQILLSDAPYHPGAYPAMPHNPVESAGAALGREVINGFVDAIRPIRGSGRTRRR